MSTVHPLLVTPNRARHQDSTLKTYASVEAAIFGEQSNDAVHILFPEKVRHMTRAFVSGFRGTSIYAVKANPHETVLRLMAESGMVAFDVASLREVELVARVAPTAKQYFMHPVKSRMAIRRAYQLGVRDFAYDSVDELKKILDETNQARDLNLYLRMDIDTRDAAYDLTGKFGAPQDQAPLLLKSARAIAQKIGLCFHVGSQCMNPLAYRDALQQTRRVLDVAGIELDIIDVGGGFPVSYPGMEPPALGLYFDAIHDALDECGFAATETLCEPGRALVAEAGATAVRVELRKGNVLYLNDGTYGSLFDAGVPNWPYDVRLVTEDGRIAASETLGYSAFGPTCDSYDKMAGPFYLPTDADEGDWVVFSNLGAYGQTMQTRFNGFQSEKLVAVGN